MSTNHTTNYDLNQWEGTDKILRTEFNADNAKIDAALKANADAIAAEAAAREAGDETIAAGNCWVKVLDLTLENATTQWDVDMSAIDLTQYQKLTICPHLKGDDSYIANVRINNLSTGYYGIGNNTSTCGDVPMMNDPTRQNFGVCQFTLLYELPQLYMIQEGVANDTDSARPSVTTFRCPTLSSGVTHLDTLNFRAGFFQLLSGSTVQIYGLKR